MAIENPIPDKSPDRITPGKPLEGVGVDRGAQGTPPSKDFESYMKSQGAKSSGSTAAGAMSPMEAVKGPAITGTPTLETLSTQAKNAQDSLGNVGEQLNTPNLKLKRAQSHLLRNKLQDANTYIRSAGSKLGVESPPLKQQTGSSPIEKFIGYVNDGQNQLLSVQQKLKEMAASGEEIRPGDMMQIQVKMNLAQQEIEYSSSLLGKVIDSLKQIMNIQL